MTVQDALRRAINRGLWVKPGHYYSPIPSQRDIARKPREPFGIDLCEPSQLDLADRLAALMAEVPTGHAEGWRWFEPNNMFGRPDGPTYYAMIAHLRPKRVVEVGSGFSSAIALDAADRHALETSFTFIEPYPARLRALLRHADTDRTTILPIPVQDVDLEVFTALEAGDILFVDSTHVVKTGSDVVAVMLHVLPRLATGVWIHVHDIFWPFAYPKRWLAEGRAWNETYLVQALLLGGLVRLRLWGSWLATKGREEYARAGSIWLERV